MNDLPIAAEAATRPGRSVGASAPTSRPRPLCSPGPSALRSVASREDSPVSGPRILGAALCAALFVAAAAAQDDDLGARGPRHDDRTFGVGDEASLWLDRDAVRGGGARYRVAFEAGHATFTPALGRRAPATMPLKLACESIERGGARVVATDPNARPARTGARRVEYRHGAVTERYEVRADGVELSFVFPTRLPGDGDLVVRLEFETDLEAAGPDASAPAGDGFGLLLPGVGGVHFGAVTGIDAGGRQVGGSLRPTPGGLELVLPAAFVDSARYPLVLDPLISTVFQVGSSGNAEDDSDVAYDAASDEYLFVYVREFSQTDTEIRAQRVDGTSNAKLGGFLSLTSTPGSSFNLAPRVGCVATSQRFVVAWQAAASPFGPWEVRCCSVDPRTGAFSATVPVATGAGSYHSPDVGGERFVDDEAIVVWDDDTAGIFAAQVNADAAGNAPVVFGATLLAAGAGDARGRPAISKSGGTVGRYLVVFETSNGLGAQAIYRQLNLLGGNIFLVSPAGRERKAPDVDGDGTSFVVAYAEDDAAPALSHDVYCQAATVSSTASAWSGGRQSVTAQAGVDEFEPAIGFLGPKYVVAWTREGSTLASSTIQAMSIDPRTCVSCGYAARVNSTTRIERFASIGSKWAGGSASDQCMITLSAYDQITWRGDVLARPFAAFGAGGSILFEAPGCGQGGLLTIGGSLSLANTVDIQLDGAAVSSTFAVLNISFPGISIASCGTCQILPPTISIPVGIANGRAVQSLRLPCDLGVRGQSIRLQYVVTPTAVGPCLALPVGLSRILRATIGI